MLGAGVAAGTTGVRKVLPAAGLRGGPEAPTRRLGCEGATIGPREPFEAAHPISIALSYTGCWSITNPTDPALARSPPQPPSPTNTDGSASGWRRHANSSAPARAGAAPDERGNNIGANLNGRLLLYPSIRDTRHGGFRMRFTCGRYVT